MRENYTFEPKDDKTYSHWKKVMTIVDDIAIMKYICSECGESPVGDTLTHYCPHCGEKMEW